MQQNKNGSLRNCELIDHTMIHLKTLVIVAMLASVAQFAEGLRVHNIYLIFYYSDNSNVSIS